jgi:hypothetical protein
MNTKKLVAVRKEAEKAIAEMPDGDLKVKAFEVILGHLLGASSSPAKRRVAPEEDENEARPAKKGKAARSATARVLVLREEGFFKNQRSMGEISAELAAHG